MKSTRRTILATSILALVSSTAAFAQTWTGSGDGVSWSQPANWTSLPASGPGAFVQFANAGPLVTNQNLGNPFTLGYLQQNTTGALTINGNALNFQGGTTVSLSSLNATINAPVILTNSTDFYATNLTLAGGLSGPGQLRMASGLVTLTGPGTWTGGTALNFGGTSTLRVGAANALTGNVSFGFNAGSMVDFASPVALTYSGSFTNAFYNTNIVQQSGPGTVLLTGVSTGNFFGTMQVATGATLQSGNVGALGAGGVLVQNSGTLQMAANNTLSGPQTTTVNAGGTLDAGGFQQTTAVRIDNDGTVFLPLASDVTLGSNSTWTGSSTGLGALTLNGFINFNAGTSLTHTGGTHQTGGQTQINTSNVLPNAGQLRVSAGFLIHSGTDTVDTVLVDGGYFQATTLTATGAVDVQSGTLSGTAITINGAFTKTTAGTGTVAGLTLAAGGTVSAGILNVTGPVSGALVNNATVNVSGGTLSGAGTNAGTITVNGNGTVAGSVANSGTIDVSNGTLSAAVTNNATVIASGGFNTISGNISGPGSFTATGTVTTLSGVNSYTGGSTATNSTLDGTTNSIQGAWAIALTGLSFTQAFAGTMSGAITGTGGITLQGPGFVTLSGNNTFDQGVTFNSGGAHLGFGSNTAAGIGGTLQGGPAFKLSAVGGARTIANPLVFSATQTDFTGTNNLTFTNAMAKTLSGIADILHTSSATTSVAGTFLGQNTTSINVNAGTLILGAPVNNGFRMDGAINVTGGGTLQMISNSPVKLGPTNISGGTLVAANGVAVPTGLALTANGTIQARVSSEAGSLIEASGGPLTLGDATSFGGFFSNGELRTLKFNVTLLDKNQAVLGSLTEVGDLPNSSSGTLTAANGLFVDFGRAITGWGTIAGTNALPQATIINGDAEGAAFAQPLDFTGYVKGLGTFSDVIFSGTFSPGLSPAIVPVNNVIFGPASTLVMEIGGLTPGSQHDQLAITGLLGLNGLLDVDLINGFNPSLGDFFNILNGPTVGTFSSFSFPALGGGLSWDTSDLYTVGNLKITPEPTTTGLLLLASASLLARRRRR